MEKLTKQEENGIWKLMQHIHNEDVAQYILKTLGQENWTRDILMESHRYLTREQKILFESLGGHYTSEELDEILDNHITNLDISDKLKELGVSHYLYENEEYLDEIREGKIVCEGINVEEIKNMIYE